MTLRLRLLLPLVLMMLLLPTSRAYAHHGPPHDEIDEFDEVAARVAAPAMGLRWSWTALVVSVAGVATAFAISRKCGVGASLVGARV